MRTAWGRPPAIRASVLIGGSWQHASVRPPPVQHAAHHGLDTGICCLIHLRCVIPSHRTPLAHLRPGRARPDAGAPGTLRRRQGARHLGAPAQAIRPSDGTPGGRGPLPNPPATQQRQLRGRPECLLSTFQRAAALRWPPCADAAAPAFSAPPPCMHIHPATPPLAPPCPAPRRQSPPITDWHAPAPPSPPVHADGHHQRPQERRPPQRRGARQRRAARRALPAQDRVRAAGAGRESSGSGTSRALCHVRCTLHAAWCSVRGRCAAGCACRCAPGAAAPPVPRPGTRLAPPTRPGPHPYPPLPPRQHDNFLPAMTARETMHFYATLQLPKSWGAAPRRERVAQVLAAMGLAHAQDTLVGGGRAAWGRGGVGSHPRPACRTWGRRGGAGTVRVAGQSSGWP